MIPSDFCMARLTKSSSSAWELSNWSDFPRMRLNSGKLHTLFTKYCHQLIYAGTAAGVCLQRNWNLFSYQNQAISNLPKQDLNPGAQGYHSTASGDLLPWMKRYFRKITSTEIFHLKSLQRQICVKSWNPEIKSKSREFERSTRQFPSKLRAGGLIRRRQLLSRRDNLFWMTKIESRNICSWNEKLAIKVRLWASIIKKVKWLLIALKLQLSLCESEIREW